MLQTDTHIIVMYIFVAVCKVYCTRNTSVIGYYFLLNTWFCGLIFDFSDAVFSCVFTINIAFRKLMDRWNMFTVIVNRTQTRNTFCVTASHWRQMRNNICNIYKKLFHLELKDLIALELVLCHFLEHRCDTLLRMVMITTICLMIYNKSLSILASDK